MAENDGFVHVGDLDAHPDALADVVAHGDEHAARTRRFVESFVRPHGIDLPAAPIMADAIEALAALSPAPAHRSPGSRLLGLVLTPIAVAASLVGGVSERIRGRRPGEPELV